MKPFAQTQKKESAQPMESYLINVFITMVR